MTVETEPRTAAGVELVDAIGGGDGATIRAIYLALAIEDESWNAALAAVEEAVGGLSMPVTFARGDSGLAGAWLGGQQDALVAIASLRKPVTP